MSEQQTGGEGGQAARRLLILEDNILVARWIARRLASVAPVAVAHSMAEAEPWLAAVDQLAAAIIDIELPDGSGLDFLERLRARSPELPALILTGYRDAAFINRATALRAFYLSKDEGIVAGLLQTLESFARRAVGLDAADSAAPPGSPTPPATGEALLLEPSAGTPAAARYVHGLGLPPQQESIALCALGGVPRKQMPELLGVSEATVKWHTSKLLRSQRVPTVRALVAAIKRKVLGRPQ
ncbi:MAG: response regulator transcription factor [Deltaproteobacteria bacterium]|nr:response regulator transcription factor [Deltaproteobacteria bacterium]